MHSIEKNIDQIQRTLPGKVTLVAVSKFQPAEAILQAYNCGQRIFGESKVQELVTKYNNLPKDIEWHMVGHLQRNKVKYIAPFIGLIQSVDSLPLLLEIEKQAKKHQRVIDCLLQFRIGQEHTKFGLDQEQIKAILSGDILKKCEHIRICGLMAMASNTNDIQRIEMEFSTAQRLFKEIQEEFPELDFHTLSMGMTSDYPIAIACGSNMIRIGSNIFGDRI